MSSISHRSGVFQIDAEREQQRKLFEDEHDDAHLRGDLATAALIYVRCALTTINPYSPNAAAPMPDPPADWPWEDEWFKPTWDDPKRMLVKAGALIAAEIDRLNRASRLPVKEGDDRDA